jgi:hypothetical protein
MYVHCDGDARSVIELGQIFRLICEKRPGRVYVIKNVARRAHTKGSEAIMYWPFVMSLAIVCGWCIVLYTHQSLVFGSASGTLSEERRPRMHSLMIGTFGLFTALMQC